MHDETELLETAFRHLFRFNCSGLKTDAAAYFLAVGPDRSDPPKALLSQFIDNIPPVKPASESVSIGPHNQVCDAVDARPSILFYVSALRRLSNNEFEFEGGYKEASRSASGGTYVLEKEGDHWRFIDARGEWLS